MNIQTSYKVTIQNRDTYCGQYDAGDDWNIVGHGLTIYQAILNAFETCEIHDLVNLNIDFINVCKTRSVVIEDETFYSLKQEDVRIRLNLNTINKIRKCHPRYINRMEQMVIENNRIAQEKERELKETELNAYKFLKEKFEGDK